MRRLAPILVGMAGGVAAIVLAATITGPIFRAVDSGASAWWLGFLFSPLIVATAGICASAWLDNRLHRNASPPPVREFHVIDDEYEHPAADSVDTHFAQVRAALNTLADHTLIPRQRNGGGTS